MARDDPVGEGAAPGRPSGEASSVTMEEFEEMLRRIITGKRCLTGTLWAG